MVQVEAVPGALDPANAGEHPVEGVGEPVHDQEAARDPQPGDALVRELVGAADRERRQNADDREVVGEDPPREARRNPAKQALLRPREQKGRLALRLDGRLGAGPAHDSTYSRRAGWFRALPSPAK